jgi:manganese-dependent inorganic pyrophosphatase
MFAVTANTEGRTLTEMLNQDMKIYDVRETKFSISQVIVTSTKDLPDEKASITSTVEAFAEKKQLDLAVLVFTSILENGSVVYYGGNRAMWAHEAFPDENNEEHSFQDGLLSRKQQILPALTKVISSYS